ncbi:MAG: glycosyltransferase [Roseitalea sp.]|nr:glycosyltransferase [Roseitalea sp.]MBO6722455.1 glycosyltransferase [Roseitalea sp.]MBO6743002.1 glycosyltransferase [Roseitalea sp.]
MDALCPSVAFLAPIGFTVKLMRQAMMLAAKNGTVAATELLAHGAITQGTYYRALADDLDMAFVEPGDVATIMNGRDGSLDGVNVRARLIWCQLRDGRTLPVTAPDPRAIETLRSIQAKDGGGQPIALTTPDTLRDLLTQKYWPLLLETAIRKLAYDAPAMSAHAGARFWQGVVSALLVLGVAVAFATRPGIASTVLHVAISTFFFSCVLLRVLALASLRPSVIASLKRMNPRTRPDYSVLVCLYKESAVIPDLIASLKKIDWPRSKLQILLICESDDEETIDALKHERLPPCFEIVRVPPAQPRTKPKALNYAMAFARGQFITLYDAEDRPHPGQLEEAWQTFLHSDDSVGCLQAPLIKANTGRNALTALFHMEYAGLFGGLMPWLVRAGSPIMLGGTSNHFRRHALERVGRWDPFNVTEDADLGMRLWRGGYRTAMITRPTLEDAPHTLQAWLPQRTRWFKGWMQTWIVHTREPARLYRNMHLRAFVITQLLLTGTCVSALLHPLVLANGIALSFWLTVQSPDPPYMSLIAWIDWLMIGASYLAFAALCWLATQPDERRRIGWRVLLIPIYWLAQSVAAWRALIHLFSRPFEWEKTPHTAHQTHDRIR